MKKLELPLNIQKLIEESQLEEELQTELLNCDNKKDRDEIIKYIETNIINNPNYENSLSPDKNDVVHKDSKRLKKNMLNVVDVKI